jgi:predicted transcriptional regulator
MAIHIALSDGHIKILLCSDFARQRALLDVTIKEYGVTPSDAMVTTPTTSMKLDAGVKERLQRLAKARRRSSHWLMREAIQQYLEREERREQLRQDALAAWADYEATGLHTTGEEVDAWLARLEAGEDAEPPEPHR